MRAVEEDHFNIQKDQFTDSKAKWVDPYHENSFDKKHVGQDKL